MAVFKCKMCGGSLNVGGESVATCEYCGTKQTLPKLDDEKRANLYDRANHFRRADEFDKAIAIYEQILNEDNTDAEAYWSLVLCKYGVEYVEDPASRKRIPTVNRAQFTSVVADEDYKSALRYADAAQRAVYEEEARAIDEIQKGILAISQKEEPFDVFICYKETDHTGRRTPDSVLAQELYFELTELGFKVFFARITLEDKLGSAYEPYIFAALNSAKVMVVLGTKPEHFDAVWVKNEWSRYLTLIKNGAKKMLIPAYKDMDPYHLPEEFSHLQAQDMSKLGFMQDLVRGIQKIAADEPKPVVVTTVSSGEGVQIDPLLRRAEIFIEDGDWISAREYCEKVLDQEPENAQAYLLKLLADCQVRSVDDLRRCHIDFTKNPNYLKAKRFGDDALLAQLRDIAADYQAYIYERETQNLEQQLADAKARRAQLERTLAGDHEDNAAAQKQALHLSIASGVMIFLSVAGIGGIGAFIVGCIMQSKLVLWRTADRSDSTLGKTIGFGFFNAWTSGIVGLVAGLIRWAHLRKASGSDLFGGDTATTLQELNQWIEHTERTIEERRNRAAQ